MGDTNTTIQRTLTVTPEVEEQLEKESEDCVVDMKPHHPSTQAINHKDGEHFLQFFVRVLLIMIIVPMFVILLL